MAYRVNPDRNKPWNGLPDLPIEESYYRTVDILEQLVNAKAAISRLQGRSVVIPDQGMLINTISLQEAKASSAIENIFTTDDELYKAYSENASHLQSGPQKEILHYREALWEGYHDLENKEKIDKEYLGKIYQKVTGQGDGIRQPFAQTYIRQGGSGPNAGKAIYTPPRGMGIVEAKLDNLLDFLNDDSIRVDPLIKMAIGHLQFEAIHPFRDGNGRTGRILNIHYLVKKGLLDYPILFLSKYIVEHKEDYYHALAGVTQRGAWSTWLSYILKAVETTANDTYYRINDIVNVKDAILDTIRRETDVLRPEILTEVIFTQPYSKVKHFVEKGIFAEKTARQYLNKLSDMHILERRTIDGNHYYLNLELYRILSQ
ncbi:MAG TPA: Fic/DOC family N-terminal domain-containing protein [Parapedobacter sp.]|uniref:Fic family protein n=1 Tax=Parapedobacter sp. TaxID=1958893 RepID=UPI002CB09E47|nr:Fic/DOC family N-terminal domain-containing protein [Parapedobacter sp.]HWK58491.1 Fic/DOC family N-terminal domain-containing protein [Parapedobacter sp.]